MGSEHQADERYGANGDDLVASENARRRALIPKVKEAHHNLWQQTTPLSTKTSPSVEESLPPKE